MTKIKKTNKLLQRILGILIIVCLIASGYFLYKYIDGNNEQYRNAEVSLVKADEVIKKKTDYRKKQPQVGTVIGKIRVEGITDDMPVIEGEDLQLAMNHGVGHIDHTTMPGTYTGQPAFSAHRETFFKALENVKIGDIVVVTMPYGTYRYKISKSIIVKPDEGAKVYTTEGIEKERIVLITCYPFSAWKSPSKRIAFFADIVE
ncbi:sortase A [Bacilli bacterium PM5-3]|nr:sortase A [Bacilli bacterium PM5-3]MDH6604040.1 sortase A [Bacilli bacterium PM5-9]